MMFTTSILIYRAKNAEKMVFMLLSIWRNNDEDCELRNYQKKYAINLQSQKPHIKAEKENGHKIIWKEKPLKKIPWKHKTLRSHCHCTNKASMILPNFSSFKSTLHEIQAKKLPKIHMKCRITQKNSLKHDKNIGVAILVKRQKRSPKVLLHYVMDLLTLVSAISSIMNDSWRENPLIWVFAKGKTLQKIFSKTQAETWRNTGACPKYFLLWQAINCDCGKESIQISGRKLLSIYTHNRTANPKIGAKNLLCKRKMKNWVYFRCIWLRPFSPMQKCKLILHLCNLRITLFWPI